MPKIKVNGKEMEAPAGAKLLPLLLKAGAFVPHYCWHPGLTPAGNCRMCLVKVSNSRKLEASCMYPVSDNLEVTTEGPEVEKARKDVMEFLLINHPLDCPICDKAGECMLQDFTFKYRGGLSRFEEPKNIRHTKDLGPEIKIWGNRCIVCTRCVRFCDEISGSGELCVVNRGDRSVVDVFPGVPIDNPLSLNVVDICPVGALIDKNFLYAARVWFASETKTVCTGCSRGCNTSVTALDGKIKRMIARENPDVNRYWMCDEGRFTWRPVHAPGRLRQGKGTARELGAAARAIVKRHGPGSVAGIVSTANTVEEIWLFRKLMEALEGGAPAVLGLSRGERRTFASGFVIEADKTANRAFAEHLLGAERAAAGLAPVIEGIASGRVKGLVVLNAILADAYPPELAGALGGLEFLGAIDVLQGAVASRANVLLPGAAWAEKDGTVVNVDRRLQRLRRAVAPPGPAEVELLQQALVEIGARSRIVSAEGAFRELAKEVAGFDGLDYGKVGAQGWSLAARKPAEAAAS